MTRLLLVAAVAAQLVLPGTARADAGWSWPVRGEVITKYRNGDDPYAGGQHRGIDIAAAPGTPVVAAASGNVTFSGTVASSGLTVSVRTADGRYDTSYLHLSSASVKEGARVERGARLGAVGTTGKRSAEAPHLHFGVREAGSRHAYHDPLEFLPPPASTPAPRIPAGAPHPVPVPLRPAPAPAREPARAAPPRRVRAPQPARRPSHSGAPARLPQPAVGAAPAATASPARMRHGSSRLVPQRPPASLGRAPHTQLEPAAPGRRHEAPATPAPAPAPAGGPDLGWALACLGLLVAAGLMGGTEDGRAAAARGRARVAATLRPLFGRG
jgi:hypothetical protein